MKTPKYNNMNAGELHQNLQEEKKRLAQLRFDTADKKLKKTSDIKVARKAIARIMTRLAQSK